MEKNISDQQLRYTITDLIIGCEPEHLSDILDKALENASLSQLISINQALAEPTTLSFLIKQLLHNPVIFKRMVRKSYYHENGFHKIVLLSGKNFKLRLHHFGAAARIPMENIHDHRWPFASAILSGELKMDIFRVSPMPANAEELYHFVYSSDKSTGSYSTELKGKAFLERTESRVYTPGESYLMRTEELHRIRNTQGEESITLILTGKPVSNQCNLYSKRPILEEEKKTVAYDPDDMAWMLGNLLEKIHPQLN